MVQLQVLCAFKRECSAVVVLFFVFVASGVLSVMCVVYGVPAVDNALLL